MGSPPFATIPCVLHREPLVLHVVLDDILEIPFHRGSNAAWSSSCSSSREDCLAGCVYGADAETADGGGRR